MALYFLGTGNMSPKSFSTCIYSIPTTKKLLQDKIRCGDSQLSFSPWFPCVPGSKLPLFPYNRGWSSTQVRRGLYTHYKDSIMKRWEVSHPHGTCGIPESTGWPTTDVRISCDTLNPETNPASIVFAPENWPKKRCFPDHHLPVPAFFWGANLLLLSGRVSLSSHSRKSSLAAVLQRHWSTGCAAK